MSEIEYGLGQFGDRRLEKGGSLCMRRWLRVHVRASAGWREHARGRFNSRAFCAIKL
jgi:hypothetical protein